MIIACECVCAAALCSIYLVHFKSDYLKQQAASTMCGFVGYSTSRSSSSSNVSMYGRQLAVGKRCSTRACRSRRHLVRSLARSTLPTNRLLLLFTVCWGKHLPLSFSRFTHACLVGLIDTCHTAINVAVQCKCVANVLACNWHHVQSSCEII